MLITRFSSHNISFSPIIINNEKTEIANAAGGRYHYIPKASADAMVKVTSEAVASLKSQNSKR